MTIQPSNITEKLKTKDKWICWMEEQRDGEMTKIPVDPSSSDPDSGDVSYAATSDSSTWGAFLDAYGLFNRASSVDGIGFVFTEDDPFVGIDLDHCRDPETGEWEDWALDVLTDVDGFREISPSGTGAHVITMGEIPGDRNRRGEFEMYEDGRYFTVTADIIDTSGERTETVPTVSEDKTGIEIVYNRHLVAEDEDDPGANGKGDGPVEVDFELDSDRDATTCTSNIDALPDDLEAVVRKAKSSKSGYKFELLWQGKWEQYGSHASSSTSIGKWSQSEADIAFCNRLAFWTGADPQAMDQIFRASGLMRNKWDKVHYSDGSTYGEHTIKKAINQVEDTHEDDYDSDDSDDSDGSDGSDDSNDSDDSIDGEQEKNNVADDSKSPVLAEEDAKSEAEANGAHTVPDSASRSRTETDVDSDMIITGGAETDSSRANTDRDSSPANGDGDTDNTYSGGEPSSQASRSREDTSIDEDMIITGSGDQNSNTGQDRSQSDVDGSTTAGTEQEDDESSKKSFEEIDIEQDLDVPDPSDTDDDIDLQEDNDSDGERSTVDDTSGMEEDILGGGKESDTNTASTASTKDRQSEQKGSTNSEPADNIETPVEYIPESHQRATPTDAGEKINEMETVVSELQENVKQHGEVMEDSFTILQDNMNTVRDELAAYRKECDQMGEQIVKMKSLLLMMAKTNPQVSEAQVKEVLDSGEDVPRPEDIERVAASNKDGNKSMLMDEDTTDKDWDAVKPDSVDKTRDKQDSSSEFMSDLVNNLF